MDTSPHPVTVEGRLDHPPGRWLWLIKWLLLIPHYIALFVLNLAALVVTIIAFFAILFTRRYPRTLFDFTVGVLRWDWRVGYYGYSVLGTDRYPPFTLADRPDYPARLTMVYPEQMHRFLPLVKWLLLIPQALILAAVGNGSWGWWSSDNQHRRTSTIGLMGAILIIVVIALLFTRRYPPGLHALLVGMSRWGYRVAAYFIFLTDRYPPFRLDQGPVEPELSGPGSAGSGPMGPGPVGSDSGGPQRAGSAGTAEGPTVG